MEGITIGCFVIWALVLFNMRSIVQSEHEQQCHKYHREAWDKAKKEEEIYLEYIKEHPPKDEYEEAFNNPMVRDYLVPPEFELFFARKRREREGLYCIGDINENNS